MTLQPAQLGVFGGSFDPPHLAHTLVAAYVLSAYELDELVVVPTARHPFDKQLTPFEHRTRMLEIALRDIRRVRISSIERELPEPSLTVRTLEALAERHPDHRLRLVIGSDLLAETRGWHDFPRVERLAPPIVVPRAGRGAIADAPALPAISSTEVRRRLREGESTQGLLCPEVEAYAIRHALY